MRFQLIDNIVTFEPGQRVVATKAVSLAEEYLADHFPSFPILPGVLMLEGAIQASSWLVREQHEFAPLAILLKQARNVTYKSFVRPGETLEVTSVADRIESAESVFTASGAVGSRSIFRAKLTLRHVPLAELGLPAQLDVNEIAEGQQKLFEQLTRSSAIAEPPLVN